MLPALYQLVVRHNFGANATVTVDYQGWDFGTGQAPEYGAVQTPINAAVVADDTDESSGDIDNTVAENYGLHGNMSVSGTSITGTCRLFLVTKTGLTSQSLESKEIGSVSFDNESGPKITSFEA